MEEIEAMMVSDVAMMESMSRFLGFRYLRPLSHCSILKYVTLLSLVKIIWVY